MRIDMPIFSLLQPENMVRLTFIAIALLLAGESLLKAQSYPLSEVEVKLVRTPHGGCFGPCTRYSVTVRGDGTVEYSGVGRVEGTRTRKVSVDDVVSLVNEFLHARFFDALETYRNRTFVVREGDKVVFRGAGGSDDPQADLTLRIGERKKTVALFNHYPAELGRLPELIERIGGPEVWEAK
jgi:uncharacterized protein DUF6438